jgi:hypothetical protein
MNCRFCLLIVLVSLASSVFAQLRVPSFEVALKGGYVNISDDSNDPVSGSNEHKTYESVYIQGEINFHIGQHIALGYFHQRSVFGDYHYTSGGSSGIPLEFTGKHLIHGLNLRLSTGRTSKLRPYIQFKYFLDQFVIDYEGFNVARDGSGAAAGLGLMMRIGHKIYINLVEVEACTFLNDSDVLFVDGNVFPTARTGITYNFSKRK